MPSVYQVLVKQLVTIRSAEDVYASDVSAEEVSLMAAVANLFGAGVHGEAHAAYAA